EWLFLPAAPILRAGCVPGPAPASSFGGSRGLNRGSSSQGFNTGGFQGFNPGGFQGFNPGNFQGFNPGEAGRSFKSGSSKHERFSPRHRFPRSFGWAGGYFVDGYGAPFYDPTLDDPLLYDTPAANPSGLSTPPIYVPVAVPGAGTDPTAFARSAVEYPGGRYELRAARLTIPS